MLRLGQGAGEREPRKGAMVGVGGGGGELGREQEGEEGGSQGRELWWGRRERARARAGSRRERREGAKEGSYGGGGGRGLGLGQGAGGRGERESREGAMVGEEGEG